MLIIGPDIKQILLHFACDEAFISMIEKIDLYLFVINATLRFSYLCKSFILLILLINSCLGLPIQQPNKDGINKDFISKIDMLA